MIKVNLLATAPGATPKREWLPPGQRAAALGLLLLLATGVGLGGWWYYLSSEKAAVDRKIAAADAELVRLKEAAKLVEKVNKRKAELTQRLDVIRTLQGAKRAPVTLLETLSLSLPDGLWLLEVKQVGTTVQIDGRALSLTAVTDFTERMQNSGVFQRPVEILTTSTEVVEEATVVRFVVKGDAIMPTAPDAAAERSAAPSAVASAAPTRTGA